MTEAKALFLSGLLCVYKWLQAKALTRDNLSTLQLHPSFPFSLMIREENARKDTHTHTKSESRALIATNTNKPILVLAYNNIYKKQAEAFRDLMWRNSRNTLYTYVSCHAKVSVLFCVYTSYRVIAICRLVEVRRKLWWKIDSYQSFIQKGMSDMISQHRFPVRISNKCAFTFLSLSLSLPFFRIIVIFNLKSFSHRFSFSNLKFARKKIKKKKKKKKKKRGSITQTISFWCGRSIGAVACMWVRKQQ